MAQHIPTVTGLRTPDVTLTVRRENIKRLQTTPKQPSNETSFLWDHYTTLTLLHRPKDSSGLLMKTSIAEAIATSINGRFNVSPTISSGLPHHS